jgi:hypothetical protein
MIHRWLILAGLVSMLAACGTGNPAFNSTAGGAGPYDVSDKFLDAQGFPLPGWLYMRDSPGGSEM